MWQPVTFGSFGQERFDGLVPFVALPFRTLAILCGMLCAGRVPNAICGLPMRLFGFQSQIVVLAQWVSRSRRLRLIRIGYHPLALVLLA